MPIPYINIPQGHGGIFTLPLQTPSSQTEVSHIGTFGCRTCVCVYIPLGNKKHFIAHIAGSTTRKIFYNAGSDAWILFNDDMVEELRDQVKQKLQPIADRHTLTPELKKRAVIICARQKVQGEIATGHHIIDVVCEAFGLSREENFKAGPHGVLMDVNKPDAEPSYFFWQNEKEERVVLSMEQLDNEGTFRETFEQEPGLEYVKCEEKLNDECWNIAYDDEMWWHWWR